MLMSISPPYPEVTLDNFIFPVDSHLAARLVVLWPPMAKVTIDKVKNVFQPKLTFFETYIKIKSISVENNGQSDIIAFFAFFVHFDKLI